MGEGIVLDGNKNLLNDFTRFPQEPTPLIIFPDVHPFYRLVSLEEPASSSSILLSDPRRAAMRESAFHNMNIVKREAKHRTQTTFRQIS